MTDHDLYVLGATVMMLIGTFGCREIPLFLLRGKELPEWFTLWLRYIPTAIFGALIFPDVFLKDGAFDLSLSNYALWASVLSFPFIYRTGSLVVAILAGTGFFCVLKYLI